MNNAQLINQTSSDVDFGTDEKILSAARRVMGGIVLLAALLLAARPVEAQQTYTVYAPVVMSSGQMSSIVWADEWEVGE